MRRDPKDRKGQAFEALEAVRIMGTSSETETSGLCQELQGRRDGRRSGNRLENEIRDKGALERDQEGPLAFTLSNSRLL